MGFRHVNAVNQHQKMMQNFQRILSEWMKINSKTLSLGMVFYLIVGVIVVAMAIMEH